MKIKLLVMDVDGTLTDGKIYMSDSGEALKAFNIKDGYGIHDILVPRGIIPIIITGRTSSIVECRCKEIGITEIYQGVKNKFLKLKEISAHHNVEMNNVAYIGDDINDYECMKNVKDGGGFLGCPADAAKEIKSISDFVSQLNGGDGAVRAFIEWLIEDSVNSFSQNPNLAV